MVDISLLLCFLPTMPEVDDVLAEGEIRRVDDEQNALRLHANNDKQPFAVDVLDTSAPSLTSSTIFATNCKAHLFASTVFTSSRPHVLHIYSLATKFIDEHHYFNFAPSCIFNSSSPMSTPLTQCKFAARHP